MSSERGRTRRSKNGGGGVLASLDNQLENIFGDDDICSPIGKVNKSCYDDEEPSPQDTPSSKKSNSASSNSSEDSSSSESSSSLEDSENQKPLPKYIYSKKRADDSKDISVLSTSYSHSLSSPRLEHNNLRAFSSLRSSSRTSDDSSDSCQEESEEEASEISSMMNKKRQNNRTQGKSQGKTRKSSRDELLSEEEIVAEQEFNDELDAESLGSDQYSSELEFIDEDDLEEQEENGNEEYAPNGAHREDSFFTDGSDDEELEIDEGMDEEEPEWVRRCQRNRSTASATEQSESPQASPQKAVEAPLPEKDISEQSVLEVTLPQQSTVKSPVSAKQPTEDASSSASPPFIPETNESPSFESAEDDNGATMFDDADDEKEKSQEELEQITASSNDCCSLFEKSRENECSKEEERISQEVELPVKSTANNPVIDGNNNNEPDANVIDGTTEDEFPPSISTDSNITNDLKQHNNTDAAWTVEREPSPAKSTESFCNDKNEAEDSDTDVISNNNESIHKEPKENNKASDILGLVELKANVEESMTGVDEKDGEDAIELICTQLEETKMQDQSCISKENTNSRIEASTSPLQEPRQSSTEKNDWSTPTLQSKNKPMIEDEGTLRSSADSETLDDEQFFPNQSPMVNCGFTPERLSRIEWDHSALPSAVSPFCRPPRTLRLPQSTGSPKLETKFESPKVSKQGHGDVTNTCDTKSNCAMLRSPEKTVSQRSPEQTNRKSLTMEESEPCAPAPGGSTEKIVDHIQTEKISESSRSQESTTKNTKEDLLVCDKHSRESIESGGEDEEEQQATETLADSEDTSTLLDDSNDDYDEETEVEDDETLSDSSADESDANSTVEDGRVGSLDEDSVVAVVVDDEESCGDVVVAVVADDDKESESESVPVPSEPVQILSPDELSGALLENTQQSTNIRASDAMGVERLIVNDKSQNNPLSEEHGTLKKNNTLTDSQISDKSAKVTSNSMVASMTTIQSATNDAQDLDEDTPRKERAVRRYRRDSSGLIKKGKWTLGSQIGKGSFGIVRMGMNKETGTLMAVKIIQANRFIMKDIRREIELLKCLEHINIVKYYGAEMDRALYIFQEWVPGGSVTSLLNKFGPFSMQVVRVYLQQVLAGLTYLHDHSILHRDIKGT